MSRQKIRFLCALLLLSFLCSLSALAQPGLTRTVRVGYNNFDGLLKREEDGEFSGYGYDYLKEISAYTGWRYQFVEGTWAECLEWLDRGKIDLLCMARHGEMLDGRYEFSEYEAGIEYAELFVPVDNDRVFYNDYASFNGLRVGFVDDGFQNELFAAFARRYGFTYTGIPYGSMAEVEEGMRTGAVDAVLVGSLQRVTGMKLVAKFSPTPYYFIATRGNTALMEELNPALEAIQATDSSFNADLYDKYYGESELSQMALTREESEYVSGHPELRVAYLEHWSPIQYRDPRTGEAAGICRGVMELLSQRSGIRFTYTFAKDEREAVALVANGDADLICGFPERFAQEAFHYSLLLTKHYFEVPIALAVSSGGISGEPDRLALPENSVALARFAQRMYPEAQLVTRTDVDACLRAMKRGEADAVLENVYVLEQYVGNSRYARPETISTLSESMPLSIGVGSGEDVILRNLLDKLISQLGARQVNEVVVDSTIQGPHIRVEALVRLLLVPLIAVFCLGFALLNFRSKKRAERYAYVDPLTGHDNENKFLLSADRLLRNKGYAGYAMVSLDIDKFKLINNMHSFETGNRILRAMSSVFLRSLGADELFCRKADDRFILLMRSDGDNGLDPRLERVIGELHALPQREGESFQLTVSCGVYLFDPEDRDIHQAIGWASLARKSAKSQRKDGIVYYDEAMRRRAMEEQEIENRMGAALADGEFVVYLQPKVRLWDLSWAGAEALVRWRRPDGMVCPDAFIPVFENNGFILQLDRYVFEEVCRQMRDWRNRGVMVGPVSVNLSRVHLNHPDFYQSYLDIMARYGIPPALIEIELTESAIFENKAQMVSLIGILKRSGVAVSMDDFGSGYSSLNLMKDLPLDFLKLDKEFFNTASDSQRGKDVVESVVSMAGKLQITVIAEGVETAEQVEFLRSIGCGLVQGYYYAKPMPVREFERELLSRQNRS